MDIGSRSQTVVVCEVWVYFYSKSKGCARASLGLKVVMVQRVLDWHWGIF
jgi:hypothetical protein